MFIISHLLDEKMFILDFLLEREFWLRKTKQKQILNFHNYKGNSFTFS